MAPPPLADRGPIRQGESYGDFVVPPETRTEASLPLEPAANDEATGSSGCSGPDQTAGLSEAKGEPEMSPTSNIMSIRQSMPVELNSIQAADRGAVEILPTAVLHFLSALLGSLPFGLGYSMAKLERAIAGTRLYDSPAFAYGTSSMLSACGIFPQVLHNREDDGLGPITSWSSEQNELFRATPLIVSNHISYLDALVLPSVLRFPKFLSMASVKSWPMFGQLGQDLEYIWVNRTNKDSRTATLEAIGQHVDSWEEGDRPLLVFPEGITSNGSSMLPFKKGAFIKGAPVRPVVLKYTGTWNPACVDYQSTTQPSSTTKRRTCMPHPAPPAPPPPPTRSSASSSSSSHRLGSASAGDQIAQHQPYTDADWALQFAGNMINSCVVMICEPYYPSPEEQEDPELFAENVRQYMIQEQEVLNLYCSNPNVPDLQAELVACRRRLRMMARMKRVSTIVDSSQRDRLKGRRERRNSERRSSAKVSREEMDRFLSPPDAPQTAGLLI